jgi:xanthine dehydrogenase accessory factor
VHSWISNLAILEASAEPSLLLTVAAVRGSAPREVGAKMIVTATESIGTIGGGQLEYKCVQLAAQQLRGDSMASAEAATRRFVLGANCGQCCGGVVDVMFEMMPATRPGWLVELEKIHQQKIVVVVATAPCNKFLITAETCTGFGGCDECPHQTLTAARAMLASNECARSVGDYLLEPVRASDFNVVIFGAGHVGTAIADCMSRLDCDIRWIDSRKNIFPAVLPANVTAVRSTDCVREVASMPPGSWFLIMTHSHPLDQEVCDQVLRRGDFAYCGLIGSIAKRRRFERRMKEQGMSGVLIERLVCPIGMSGIDGKKPAEIAIAVTAEILQLREASLREKSGFDKATRRLRAC